MPSPFHHRRVPAAVAVVLGAVATATNPVFVRLADVELVASAFHRMFWAIPLFAVWAWISRRGRRDTDRHASPPRRHLLLLGLCGVFFAADLASLHSAISLTHAANAILFLNAQPIYVGIIGWLVFGTLVTRRYILSAAVAMGGALMLVWQSADFGRSHLAGDGLAVLAGICYAAYIIIAARLRANHSSAEINLWACIVGALVLLFCALAAGQDIVPHSGRDWALMIALGLVSQAAGQGLIVWGLAYLPAGFSAVALLVAPVAAAGFAWLLLGEVLDPFQLVAIAVVLIGIHGAWRSSFPVVQVATPK